MSQGGYDGGDPLSRVHGSVQYDRRFGSFSSATEEVNPSYCLTLQRVASGNNFRIGRKRSSEIIQKLDMIGVRMVSVEPCRIGTASLTVQY